MRAITGYVSKLFTTRLFVLSAATHSIRLPIASRSRYPDQLSPVFTVLGLVALPLGTLRLEAPVVALDKVCFTLRSFRFCLVFRRTTALSPLTPIGRWGSDPGTAGQRHYPELGTRSPLVVV
jgi:hypothetical protein